MNLTTELSHYGINGRSRSVRWFRGNATPELIDYLDLVGPASARDGNAPLPDGVAENQDRPLLYFVDANRLATQPNEQQRQVAGIQRALACRGDRAYLAIVRAGTLDVIPVSLQDQTPAWKTYQAGTGEALTFFSRLALGRCEDMPGGPDVEFLFEEMFQLVDKTATRLEQLKLKRTDVLSLVGRALFFRFLIDRGIVKAVDLKKVAPKASTLAECFDTAANAAATSAWLDRTFNGDFLPLTDDGTEEFFAGVGQRTGQRVFVHLSGIARGEEPSGDDGFQLRLPIHWGHLDFAHIPVGLLSQVYERLSWKWDDHNARSTSVHYTPRNIAATLVGEAFDKLPNAAEARLLDPACGAGVFLVIAFRRLYRELWRKTQERPDTKAIRSILEQQLVGFDISDSALKLCALSLYLTAIELDPDPAPPEKLRFKALRGGRHAMLFDWRQPEETTNGPVVGSIGPHVPPSFDGAFDLVLCNPPWTIIAKKYKEVAEALNTLSQQIVVKVNPELSSGYQNPDSVPDLPFIWRALEWCKPGGRIAMALPARTLFKQGPMAWMARKTLFASVEVTGIINCANLRKTKVWPEMDQPFMLLFARNQRPKSSHRLSFISPHTDLRQNSLGEMRIDSKSTQAVAISDAIETPWLWKALSVGTALDVEVVRKVKAASDITLEEYWVGQLKLSCGNGYQIKAKQKQKDARPLRVLRNLNSTSQFRFSVDPDQLEFFSAATACWPRIDESASDPLRVYRGPLALVKEAPGPDRTMGWALYSEGDLAFNQSFYGYSAAGHPDGVFLVKYLQLFVHSRLWLHYALATSGKLGFERPNVYKRDLDHCPFIPVERLSDEQRKQVGEYSRRLLRRDETVFPDLDVFFGRLYGLTNLDLEVINDTLTVREPNDELGVRASTPPTKPECTAFGRRLESILRPLFKKMDLEPDVVFWKPADDADSPFVVFNLGNKGDTPPETDSLFREAVLPLANETGASRIIKVANRSLVIGLLRQYRYWTPSRARMLAAEIIRYHLGVFEG